MTQGQTEGGDEGTVNATKVRDLMVPIDEYPAVSEQATLVEAIRVFNAAQKNLAPGRQPYRAVLVRDDQNRVVGKLGQMAFLRALEPRRNLLKNVQGLDRAGVNAGYIDSIMANYRLFEETFSDMCLRGLQPDRAGCDASDLRDDPARTPTSAKRFAGSCSGSSCRSW